MRNVWLLCLAQSLAACGTIMLVAFGGIIGSELAPSAALATLPLSLSIVGLASMSLPAAMLMQRVGRKPAFVGSALVAMVAALLCSASVANESFAGLCVAGLLLGSNMAFVQQYRFAATEYVAAADAGRAVGTVMLGTLAAAFAGPLIGELARDLGGARPYTASFVALAVLCLAAALVLSRLDAAPSATRTPQSAEAVPGRAPAADQPGRPIGVIAAQPTYRLALLSALVAYAAMSFIMTATPISMHVHHGYSSGQTSAVISAHLIGMYLPSLATPWFMHRLRPQGMLVCGAGAMALCIAIAALVGHEFLHYFAGLVLLGIGWNFMFVAATALLTTTYSNSERFRAQGFNDFAVFGSQAIASLLAGPAISALGWTAVNLLTLPLLGVLLLVYRATPRTAPIAGR